MLLFVDFPNFHSKHEPNIIPESTSSALLNKRVFLYIHFAHSYFLPLVCGKCIQTKCNEGKKRQK